MKNENQKIKYFLYARRSIKKKDKEEKVVSVESQLKEMKDVAREKGLNIVRVFKETQSAKEPYIRKKFTEMIEGIQAGQANGILCWKMDRLARNPVDEGTIKYLLQNGVIQNIKASDRDWYPDDNVLLASVEFGVATQYSRDLAKHIRRGLQAKLEGGHRPSIAPLGYLNSKYKTKGFEEILVDDERFDKVRQVFDLMLTGQYNPFQLVQIADKDLKLKTRKTNRFPEKPMSKTNMYRLLTNPFYYGEFEYPEKSGSWYIGKHKAMISKEEYDKVQFLLGRDGKPRPKTHIFAFTGLMRCTCGGRITAEEKWKHQKNGNVHHYVYYHCTGKMSPKCTEKSIEVKVLEEQIDNFLSRLAIPPEFREWAIEELKKKHEKEKQDRNSIIQSHQVDYKKCVKRLDSLMELRLDGKISDEMYKRKESELLREKNHLRRLVDGDDTRVNDWLETLNNTLTFAEKAREEFQKGDMAKKRQILTVLGTEHVLSNRKIDIQTEKPLLILQEVASETSRLHERLEPVESVENKQQIKDLYSKSSLLWRWAESNRRARRNEI